MKTVSTFRNRSTNVFRTLLLALVAVITLAASASAIQIRIDMGRKSRDCRGFGICSITVGTGSAESMGDARLNGNQLTISLPQSTGTHEEILPIDEAIELDPQTARALGAARLVIPPGKYQVDYSSNPNGEVTIPVQRVGVTVSIEPGRRSKGCNGFGICSITITLELLTHPTPTVATMDGNELTLDLMEPTPERGDVMIIDEDIVLDSATSLTIGRESLVVKKGSYPVDYSSNPNGTIRLLTAPHTTSPEASGISINVKIGRREQGCRGFGICMIWIGADNSGEATQATAQLKGNNLHINFQQQLNERGTALVIDEPIELDEETSLALGSHKVVVLPGTYPVDYSSNPNGSVDVRVQSIGVTIGIDIGRPKRECTGIGVCKVWLEFDLRQGTTPTVAWLQDSTLTLLFKAELPEQGETFTIDDDIKLDREVARKLGAKEVVIRHGAYPIRRNAKGEAYVELPVSRIGITVTIDVGRRSRDCRGFGVCSITIGVDFTERSVQGAATVENGVLELDFLGESPETDDIFAIDEGITVDKATAAALGIGEILPGAYLVDRSNNEYGTVQLAVGGANATVGQELSDAAAATQAMPNPTSGMTTLRFNVAQGGPVSVMLTDARGTVIAQLLEERMEAGVQSVNFDAGKLAAGVYFYTIHSATETASGRMIVTR